MEAIDWFVSIGVLVLVTLCGRLTHVALVARDRVDEFEEFLKEHWRCGQPRSVEMADLRAVVDYLYEDEKKSFESCTKQEQVGHVFHHVGNIKKLIDAVNDGASYELRLYPEHDLD